jgi:carboxylesterase type B
MDPRRCIPPWYVNHQHYHEHFKGGATDFDGLYFGEHLASLGEVIVVTYNYRLGPLGYLSHRHLRTESKFNTSGNYALQDGIAAHQWVKNNIRKFKGKKTNLLPITIKGDPDNITAFGESAGASHSLLFAFVPQMEGLVHKVCTLGRYL